MKKTIWFDFANSPQVKFYAKIINELKKEHNVLLTCRPLANTTELLDMEGLEYHIIGKHYGLSKFKRIVGIFRRVFLLWIFLRKQNIDVGVSHSSFYQPIVSWLLGKRSIYINDNEHAAWNPISIRLATVALFPEPLKQVIIDRNWKSKGEIILYPGIKEGVYLWDYQQKLSKSEKKRIYIRTEPWNADYYKGDLNFIDELIIGLANKYEVNILPRGENPIKHYSAPKFQSVKLHKKSLEQYEIFNNCDLFIGAGGSMTREAATVGIPTISIYQDTLLSVDKFLTDRNVMIHNTKPTTELIDEMLSEDSKQLPHKDILDTGLKAHKLILKTILY
jgi:predicted glycosyltransferase